MIKVSVIVPVYNVEDYIRECIVSLVNQTLDSIEIIVVNDGTLDRSIEKIKDLLDKYPNIKLINKENGGLSSARNEGLKYAKGKYIAFVDSDDYVEKDFLEILYHAAEAECLDIVFSGYKRLLSDGHIQEEVRNSNLLNKVYNGVDYLAEQFRMKDYKMEVWDDLYNREFLEKHELAFYDKLIHEDDEFTPKVLLKANRVKLINHYGYIYRQRENSIMNSKPNPKVFDSLQIMIAQFLNLFSQEQRENAKVGLSYVLFRLVIEYNLRLMKSDLNSKRKQFMTIFTKDVKQVIRYRKKFTHKENLEYYLLCYMPKVDYYLRKLLFGQ